MRPCFSRCSPRSSHRASRRPPRPGPSRPADTEAVGRRGANRTVLPVNQVVTPLGRQVELPGLRPQAVALSPDGRLLITSERAASSSSWTRPPARSGNASAPKTPADQPPPSAPSANVLEPDKEGQLSYTGLRSPPTAASVPERRQRLGGRVRRGGGRRAQRRAYDPPARRERAPAQGGDPGRPRGVRRRREALRLWEPVQPAVGARRGQRPRAATFDVGVAPTMSCSPAAGLTSRTGAGASRPGELTGPAGVAPRSKWTGEARRQRGVADGDRARDRHAEGRDRHRAPRERARRFAERPPRRLRERGERPPQRDRHAP